MSSQFKTIAIYGRVRNPGVIETLKALVEFLRGLNQHFLVENETATSIDDPSLPRIEAHHICERCDLLIVVGGDGSILHAAHSIVSNAIPVLGINRGRLGFLTDILPQELNKIKAMLAGEYTLEKRFLLTATMSYQGKVVGTSNALNEVALIPDSVHHMNEFEIYIDDQFLCSQNSDGVIVATPTGSTAYALSGGGPILHPQLDAIVIVPMFSHTLSIRPIVLEGHHTITVRISPNNTTTPRLTCDSQDYIDAPPSSQITISKKAELLHLIHPLDYNYYETLRSKLHWGRKLQYTD